MTGYDCGVELILAGDFFDFLQISPPPPSTNRAALTLSRPEYIDLFGSLKRFNEKKQNQVIYLPGNHDAESWWNPEIQETLRAHGLVDEFAFSYRASFEVGGERRIVYSSTGTSSILQTPLRIMRILWIRRWGTT